MRQGAVYFTAQSVRQRAVYFTAQCVRQGAVDFTAQSKIIVLYVLACCVLDISLHHTKVKRGVLYRPHVHEHIVNQTLPMFHKIMGLTSEA